MTEKRYKSIGANLECPNGMEYMLIKRNDGFNVCQVCSKYTAKEIVDELNSLADENEQLKKDCTVLIYHNQDYRKENEQLKTQLMENNCDNCKYSKSIYADVECRKKGLTEWKYNCDEFKGDRE